MCKTLYHTTYPTSVPYHLMTYALVMFGLYNLCKSCKSLMKIVLFFSFSVLLAVGFLFVL